MQCSFLVSVVFDVVKVKKALGSALLGLSFNKTKTFFGGWWCGVVAFNLVPARRKTSMVGHYLVVGQLI